MENNSNTVTDTTELISEYLETQGTLTAIEEFTNLHDSGAIPSQETHYKSLIPTSLLVPQEQFAFEVDLDKCTGCKACVTGCHSRNGLDQGETWRSVGLLQGTSKSDLLENFLGGNPQNNTQSGVSFLQHVTTACHHCLEPSCLSGCPVNAYDKDPFTGIVKHLDDQCIGCQYCVLTCPYGVPQYNDNLGIVRKCDMCTDRLTAGEAPACVQACPNEAIRIIKVDINSIPESAEEHFGLTTGPNADFTKPTTKYIGRSKSAPALQASDDPDIKFQHPEWPLVLMLVLTQASVGGMFFQSIFGVSLIGLGLSLFTGLIGLMIAPLHLGRPLYAFRVILGLKHSWLSREAVIFGGYLGSAVTFSILSSVTQLFPELSTRFPGIIVSPGILDFIFSLTLFTGILGVFSSGMVYMVTPRSWWASSDTMLKFFLTTAILGTAITQLGSASKFWVPLLVGLTTWKLSLEYKVFNFLINKDHPFYKPAKLMKKASKLNGARYILGFFGGIVLPIYLLAFNTQSSFYFSVTLGSILLLLIGEIIERLFFFMASAPPKMPGCISNA